MDAAAKLLLDYLRDVIYHPESAALDVDKLPGEFQEFGKGLVYFATCILETSALAKALSKGNLNGRLPAPGNEIAAPLKALHAALKHLTWQTQQVAKGDYQQRVDFMGDFSDAFNAMTEQLERQRTALLAQIEEGRRKTKALEQSNNLFEAITNKISQWIIVMDGATFAWLFANHYTADVLRDPRCEPKLRHWLKRQAQILCNGSQSHVAELELMGKAGPQYFSVEMHQITWYQHNAVAFALTDISTEKERLNDLQDAAYTDKLTQIYSRHYGMKVLSEWLADNQAFALCFVDIDNLKYVNDKFGHAEGDKYIIAVAGALHGFAPGSILCRLGGDEFLLLVQGWSSDKATERMEELRTGLICRDAAEGALYERSISYGVIEIGVNNTLSANDLLRIVDEKMYEYKRTCKVQCSIGPK